MGEELPALAKEVARVEAVRTYAGEFFFFPFFYLVSILYLMVSHCVTAYMCVSVVFNGDWMNGNLKSEEVDRVEFDSCCALLFISITIRIGGGWEVNWGKNAILQSCQISSELVDGIKSVDLSGWPRDKCISQTETCVCEFINCITAPLVQIQIS